MKLLNMIKERWNSTTPPFFKGIKRLVLSVGTSAMSIILANQSLSLDLNDDILSVCKYIVTACIAMGMTSQLTMTPK